MMMKIQYKAYTWLNNYIHLALRPSSPLNTLSPHSPLITDTPLRDGELVLVDAGGVSPPRPPLHLH